ncbi:hypothetical protein ACFO8O_16425 [Hephaestia sp. GCM10023244]|uniref:hypothetical protein n=1 Tax=unclassified Hephaestia TaxID=2631281 RepID=UPI00207705F0|nr:hypothetical protein [Hephaestia sp. MAHUQ-44]MCM8732545.1 hypothetical protein [Hephaestia sp. MAHUQ-44]
MTTLHREAGNRSFIDLQHRFRGLVATFRSKRFVEERRVLPERVFRSGLQDLLLDARAAIEPGLYRTFLEWTVEQSKGQLNDLAAIPVAYDELTGIYSKAPTVALENELLWITERVRGETLRINALVQMTRLVQSATFAGAYEEAIVGVSTMQTIFGVSLWSVQLRLALEHLAGGLERQKRYAAELRNVHRVGLLNFTVYHTSVRNEDRTTLGKFMDDVEARISAVAVHSEPTKTYDRYRLKGDMPATDIGLAEILRVEQSHGIVDVYETYIAILQELARRSPSQERVRLIMHCVDQLEIDDFRLTKIQRLLDSSRNFELPQRDTAISDALFEGNIVPAIRRARKLSSDDPWDHIYSGFALSYRRATGDPIPAKPTNVAALIARIQSRCDGSEDAWAQLAKLALNLRALPLAAGLLESAMQLRRSQPDQPWRPWLIGLNSPAEGPEDRPWDLGCALGPHAEGVTGAAWYEAACPDESDAAAHKLLRAIGHIHRGDFENANRALGGSDRDWPEPLRNLRALVQLHALHALGERQRIITLLASEGTRSATHVRFLPVVSALRGFAWQDFKAVDHPLASPIALHLLWTEEEVSETASRLRFATGHALRQLEVSRPSDLEAEGLGVEQHELVYFLRYICVPNILDLTRLFSGTRAILEERQTICGLLARIDAPNIQDYQDEIITIANDLELDEGQWIVDSTRIHVDSDGLMRWASKELSEDYERYRDLIDIDIDGAQNFEDVLRELAANPAQRSNFVPKTEADAVLFSIFRRLGEEFLNNASFGLDFYLSKRVRHQSFIGLIRGPLEFANLITTRESEAGEYHRNDAWLNRFNHLDEEARFEIDGALRAFAMRFDEIISQAKDTYFHLRSIDKPQGMITLNLNERMVGLARALIRLDLNFPEFIRVAVPILWAAIETSLAAIRTFIADDIKPRVIKEFDIVRARVRALAEQEVAWLEFDAAMGGAANEVQRKLDEVAQWFVHADTLRKHRLFSLEQILKIGVDTALKSQRGFAPEISQIAEGDLNLHSANLVFVHDVVFVGLGNARKHSGLKAPHVDVTARWNEDDATLTLSVVSDCRASNRTDKEKQATAIRKIIADGAHDRRTRTEEGSGFAKLAAVVMQSPRGKIDFGFDDEGRFRLDVTYAIIQFSAEAPDAA